MERRKLRRRTGWALLFSLLAHLLLILTAAWFTILGVEPTPEPVEEIEITIIQPPPALQKPQFVDTSAPAAEKPPEDALFESDRDTAAAAPEAAAGAEPLPSQEGRKQDFLELEQEELALAQVDQEPPAPETPPAEPAPPEPPQPEEQRETRSEEEKPEPVEADALLASAQPKKRRSLLSESRRLPRRHPGRHTNGKRVRPA
jgi:Predicted membrane protein